MWKEISVNENLKSFGRWKLVPELTTRAEQSRRRPSLMGGTARAPGWTRENQTPASCPCLARPGNVHTSHFLVGNRTFILRNNLTS